MNEVHTLMLSLTIYKIVTIFAGLAFAFMGYKLFIHGVFGEAGELQTNWENRSLVLKRAAPGTFFALFGTIILCASLWRGLTIEPTESQGRIAGSGLFGTSTGDERRSGTTQATRQAALDDVAALNRFADELVSKSAEGEATTLTIATGDGDGMLDFIDRMKTTLMLSVWSPDWGDQEEFRRWAQRAPGYYYSDPPRDIALAAAIFKGEVQ